ncbi:MAG: DoxX family protein [Alphaproteobacteria bacterium]|nr:DoxX family protein [Alphaproteobacteria bacterium]NCQ67090.1 DoxX family protein [Alphaproteobacteria bacterium]NCT07687.1 DoxX family protein [Alphaproteobacteria bacterium]
MRSQEETGLAPFLTKYISPLVDLTIRLYMANIFFKSGWLKFQNYMNNDWDSTLFLFSEVHPVPFLSPEIAAILGTAGELGLSTLLALGLFARFSAFGLLMMTAVIQIVMPTPQVHLIWAIMLGTIFARGAGSLSVDAILKHLLYRR